MYVFQNNQVPEDEVVRIFIEYKRYSNFNLVWKWRNFVLKIFSEDILEEELLM